MSPVQSLLDGACTILRHGIKTDTGAHRLWLLIEEVKELVTALQGNSEEGVLDALADISYVVEGTAVLYDLPLDAAFKEVHRSNMTKGSDAKFKTNLAGKGTFYSPPDIKRIIEEHRNER